MTASYSGTEIFGTTAMPLTTIGNEAVLSTMEEECINRTVLHKAYPTDGVYCNRTFDGYMCWDDTPSGQRVQQLCPSFVEGFHATSIAFKDCTENGTWWKHPTSNQPWTNYTQCVHNLEEDKQVVYIYIAGYSVSTCFLAIALGIFFYYKQLQCDRVLIHQHLFLSYILTGIVWILSYKLVYLNTSILIANPVWCQVMHVAAQMFTTCNFFWMFCEGLYLHTIIVTPFNPGTKLMITCYAIGWVSPLVPTAIYAGVRAVDEQSSYQCWIVRDDLQYIVQGPIILSLLVNLVFLLNIVRILLTKLRASNARQTCQTRKAVRATLILVPLLGLQFLLNPVQPSQGTPGFFAHKCIVAVVVSFQGFFVALLFCFLHGEVRNLLGRKWRNFMKERQNRRRSKSSMRSGETGRMEMSLSGNIRLDGPAQPYTEEFLQSMTSQDDSADASIDLLQSKDEENGVKPTNGHVLK